MVVGAAAGSAGPGARPEQGGGCRVTALERMLGRAWSNAGRAGDGAGGARGRPGRAGRGDEALRPWRIDGSPSRRRAAR